MDIWECLTGKERGDLVGEVRDITEIIKEARKLNDELGAPASRLRVPADWRHRDGWYFILHRGPSVSLRCRDDVTIPLQFEASDGDLSIANAWSKDRAKLVHKRRGFFAPTLCSVLVERWRLATTVASSGNIG